MWGEIMHLYLLLLIFPNVPVEVWICHVVSVGEFYIQCPEQRQSVNQLSPSLSSLSPGPLSADGLKEGQSPYIHLYM